MVVDVRLPNVEKVEETLDERTIRTRVNPDNTWDTVTWLMSITNLPVVVKGILTGHCCTVCFKNVLEHCYTFPPVQLSFADQYAF